MHISLMKNMLFSIVYILTMAQVNGQNYDFGKVSKEELQEKTHALDSSASAAVLYKNENISFYYAQNEGFMQQREVHERIKIYNKDGFDWATEKVYLRQSTGQRETVSKLKAYSYNLVNGKIEKDKLEKDGKFQEDYNEFVKISSFTLPNVKEGTVIEYRYIVNSPLIGIDDVIFQYNIPINKLEVRIATPEYYIYNKLVNLRASFQPKFISSSKNTSIPFDFKTNIDEISELNIPALKSEAYSGNLGNYRSKMSIELTAILNADKILEKSFSSTWEEVSKTIYDSSNFGEQLTRFSIYKDDLETLVEGVEDDFEKAAIVEKLVKSKVKWNGSYGKYAQKGVRLAYKEGEGNVADINLMVVSMLRSQGVNANPVLISTRNNGIPLFPTREGFNYVICSVQSEGKNLLIDATELYSSNNVLPHRVLNWQGRLIKDKGVSEWVDVKPNKKSLESTMLNIQMDDEFVVSGKVSKNLTLYNAYNYRTKYSVMTNEDHIKSLETDKGDVEISELNFENNEDVTKPVKVSYQYELSDGVDEVGDKLYFSPFLFLATKENPFKLEERQYPIDFILPYEDRYMINIAIPEGYVVEYIPTSEAVEFKGGEAKLEYIIRKNGNYIQLKAKLDIVNPLILPEDYKDFKAFFGKIVEKQAEQIVLTKA